jgi:hypothetical protein
VVGLGPRQIDELTAWEFSAFVTAWKAANCPDEGPKAPSADEHDEMVRKYG